MLSILNKELNDFSDHSILKNNVNEIYSELVRTNYERVIQICDLSIEICERIMEKAINDGNDEDVANSMFVVRAYCKMLKNYSSYWQTLIAGRYKDSWIILQDTIDRLIDVTKFTVDTSEFGINEFNDHLNNLEKLYPYHVFASIEMVIKTKECSICGNSILDLGCTHIPGNLYWGKMAVSICKDIVFQAVALVTHPMDKRCVIELSDDKRTDKEKFKLLDYFVENVDNPFQLFSLNEEERIYYNEYYKMLERNDKCFCGSGKKFKKCHGKSKYEKGSHVKIMLEDEFILKPLTIVVNKVSPIA